MGSFLTQVAFNGRYQQLSFYSALALYFLILIGGAIPGARDEMGEVASGFVLHSVAYSSITFLLFSGCVGSPPVKAAKAFMLVAAMGAFDEYFQTLFPYRYGTVTDWVVDISASFITLVFLLALRPRPRRPAMPADRGAR